jgi:23S rRNA (adenine-C8)-methyltransferase
MTSEEITDQILYFQQEGKKIDSISFMGMGEPLQNPKVFEAISMLTDKDLFGFSQRHLSVSTVGIIPGIQKLTKNFPNVNLAFSLHSPFDDQRDILVPTNKQFPLAHVRNVYFFEFR